MSLRDAPIKRKLYVIIMGTAAAVLLLSLVASLAVQIGVAREHATTHLRALATVLADNSRAAIVFGDREAAAEVLATLTTQGDVRHASILTPTGEVFASHDTAGMAGEAPAARGGPFAAIIVEQPILFDGAPVGRFRIVGDLSRAREILALQAFLVLGVFVVALLLALLLSSRLQRIVSVPVQRLLEAMERVGSARDLGLRAERVSNDELGRLTDGFNEMLDRMQQYDHELENYRQGLEQQVVRRTEELEWSRQRAEAASKAKSEFLATISHEIRTPMTGVIGFTRLLEKTELDNQQRDYTRIIGSSANSLLDIIDEILDFSKMEAGKVELERRDFGVADLLDVVRVTLTPRALEKGITLSVGSTPAVPAVLHGDPVRLRQILLNLVGNAVKFTDEGSVHLQLDRAGALGRDSAGFTLEISVSDTGIGISPEQQALLFQPFQQGDGSISRRFGGTGLGLVITRRLVQLMDGDIKVSSAVGEGSTFTATVQLGLAQPKRPPAAGAGRRPTQQALVSAEEVAPALAGLRILVVDDSPVNLKLATALLASRGVEVAAVESGAEALQAIAGQPFDLVLMDLEMPTMSGIETAERIRATRRGADELPIVAVTAHAFPEKRQEAIEAGMNDLLAKPYLPEQLYSMIVRWCVTQGLRGDTQTEPTGRHRRAAAYDRAAALKIVGGDAGAAQTMLDEFLQLLPASEEAVRSAHTEADYQALYQAVHKLAGSTPVVGATALHAAAVRLQNFLKLEPRPVARIDAGVAELLEQSRRFRTAVDR